MSCSTEYTFTSIISFIRHRASFHLLPPFRHDVTEPGGKSCSFLKGDLLPSVLRTTSYQFAVSSRRPNSFRILDHRIGNPNCGVNSDNVWNRTSFVVLFFSNYFFCLTTDQKKRSGDVTKQSPVDAEKFLSLYQTIFS